MTIALVWLGHVTVTGAELYLSAASWSFEAELMDPRRRGEYQGAAEFSGTLGRVWAPALYTFLAMNWGAAGWLLIAAIVVAATAGCTRRRARAQRFLEQHGPPPERCASALGRRPPRRTCRRRCWRIRRSRRRVTASGPPQPSADDPGIG